MTIKTITTFAAALAICAAAPAVPAAAQAPVGQWYLYPVFNGTVTDVVETPSQVYYLSSGRLYSFGKDDNQTISYSTHNKLNDTNITGIFYDDAGARLVLAYDTGNIDVIDQRTGRVHNMSDISDAVINGAKTINDVCFDGRTMYVATAFGLIEYDLDKRQVVQSGIYGIPVTGVAVNNGTLFILSGTKNAPYGMPLGKRINDFSAFSPIDAGSNTVGGIGLVKCGNDLLTRRASGMVIRLVISDDGTKAKQQQMAYTTTLPIQGFADGTAMVRYKMRTGDEAGLIYFDAGGNVSLQAPVPGQLAGQTLTAAPGLKSIWGVDADGLAHYSLEGDNLTVLSQKSKPEAITCDAVAFIKASKNAERIYISKLGSSRYKTIAITSYTPTDVYQRTDVLTGGVPAEASVFEATMHNPDLISQQAKLGTTRMVGSPQRIAVDPVNPDRYYIANLLDGVSVVENNKEIGHFSLANMPTYCFWGGNKGGALAMNVDFDPQGNLWVGCWILTADETKYSPYTVLPAAKLRGDLSAITAADWKLSKHLGHEIGSSDMGTVFSTKSHMMFNYDCEDSTPLTVTDTKGTYANTDDDVCLELSNVTDQDGKEVKPQRWICAVEDKRGRIWFGTTSGIIEVTNPAKAMDADFTYTRLKVPRNDGTNYADYLLESERINDIAVDSGNRKWIATENSGVYLVSENGDKIIEHYTAQNSSLPSNAVYAVYCDPNSNTVYFGLASGLISFSSTSAPAAQDFSDVYAYPNPVRPDYTGWITIKGLMDNSLVKIADAAGNVFYQGRSEGGMMVWDGCNAAGERVKSGVYFVFASQTENDNTTGAVTKIMVIN